MAPVTDDDRPPLSLRGLFAAWVAATIAVAPIWIWQDGKYGLVKAAFFALFFAHAFRIKRDILDIGVFALIMTGMQVFSRQAVNYHQLVFDAHPPELVALTLHAALTLGAAWLMSWLFDLRRTPGSTYTRLAAFYMIFYLGEFCLHALGVMLWRGLTPGFYHFFHFALLLSIPYGLWWAGSKVVARLGKSFAGWRRPFGDFESTRNVVFSCLGLYAASVVWFALVHFAIAKLGIERHYGIASGCQTAPDLGQFLQHALKASLAMSEACLTSASILSRAADYLSVIVSLFLLLVLIQAIALAFGAQKSDQPPRKSE